MKLVKEYINEKFTEDSDPLNDMGIGIVKLIEDGVKRIFNIDIEEHLIPGYGGDGNINRIRITDNIFSFEFYSDEYCKIWKNSKFNRKRYCKYLLKRARIYDCFEKNPKEDFYSSSDAKCVKFKIKEEFIRFFQNGVYDEMSYISSNGNDYIYLT